MDNVSLEKEGTIGIVRITREHTMNSLDMETFDDLGKVIGKQGKTARAMRTILSAAGTKLGKRCVLEILE